MSKMYIFPVRHPRTWQHILPTFLITVLRENGSPGATSSAAYSSCNSQTRPGGGCSINRSRLIVNNRQIIRNSRASSIASLQYNRHQKRRPTTAGLQLLIGLPSSGRNGNMFRTRNKFLYWGGRINGPRHFQPPTPCKHNTTPKQRPRRRQEHLLFTPL